MTDEKLTSEDDVEGHGRVHGRREKVAEETNDVEAHGRSHIKPEAQIAKDVQAHAAEGERPADDVVAHKWSDPERKVQ